MTYNASYAIHAAGLGNQAALCRNLGSDYSVRGPSRRADDAASHSLHAQGQAGGGELDSVRVLKGRAGHRRQTAVDWRGFALDLHAR